MRLNLPTTKFDGMWAQLLPVLFEDRVIAHPGPLPATARGLTLARGMTPQRDQHVQTQASESLDPGALGQRPEQAQWQVLVPAPDATQLGVGAATEQRR